MIAPDSTRDVELAECAICGESFERRCNGRGRPAKYCGDGCRSEAAKRRRQELSRCVDCHAYKGSRTGERCPKCAAEMRSRVASRAIAERDAYRAVLEQLAAGDEPVARAVAAAALAVTP